MNIQETIENLILDYILKKQTDQQEIVDNLLEKRAISEKEYNETIEKLCDFELRHTVELRKICDINRRSFLCSVHNDLGNQQRWEDDDLEQELKQYGGLRQFVCITYGDFEKDLGLSHNTIKKYSQLLEEKGKIVRKKGFWGFSYKFPDDEINSPKPFTQFMPS